MMLGRRQLTATWCLVVWAVGSLAPLTLVAQDPRPKAPGGGDRAADRDLLDRLLTVDPELTPEVSLDIPRDSTNSPSAVPLDGEGTISLSRDGPILATGAADESSPLVQIQRNMREVQQRLRVFDADPVTQQIERDIVDNLESLISQLATSCREGASSPQTQLDSNRQPQQSSTQLAGNAPAGESDRTTRDGNVQPGQPALPKTDAEPRGAMGSQPKVWGNLPPDVQQMLIQAGVERFLPKYERLIEDYYRRLSEQEMVAP